MNTETPNTETLTVPQAESKTETPKAELKPKRTRKAKPTVSDAVKLAVERWQHGIAPEGLHAGSVVHKLGAKTGRVNKLNQAMVYKTMSVITPSATALMRDNPGMTKAQAEAKVKEIGSANKPLIMGRVQLAASSPDYIVRRYTETPNDKGRHRLAVALERVNTEDWLTRTARELNISVEECRKRLKMPPASVTLEV